MKLLKMFTRTSIALILASVAEGSILTLSEGTTRTDANWDDLAANSVPYGIAGSGQDQYKDSLVNAFYVPPGQSTVYSLSSAPALYATPYPSGGAAKRWPLKRWAGESAQNIQAFYEMPDFRDFRDKPPFLTEYVYQRGEGDVTAACMMDTPLRFGDVLASPGKEVVLYLGKGQSTLATGLFHVLDIIFVSSTTGSVLFSLRAMQEDQGAEPGDEDYYSPELPPTARQYESGYIDYGGGSGTRIYAKMYIDDFNGDGVQDVIVWRKRFLTRLVVDPVHGFFKDGEMFQHYSYASGTYILKSTTPAQIKTWLAAKNLTWSKGYPNKSECPGHTNELIPEMHDPLLNDPEVLR